MKNREFVRIGSGAGYSGDRIEPAIELVEQGDIDYLCFECLAERTIALAQLEKSKSPHLGYDPLLRARMQAVLAACVAKKIKIITNMGAANPQAAAELVQSIAREKGITQLRIAYVTGDEVTAHILEHSYPLIEREGSTDDLQDRLISANAYLGVKAIVEALEQGADVVITGRVADPALFYAPLVYEFGWSLDDANMLGKATMIGHLLECAGQITGGYFADPGYKDVPNLAHIGFPFADVWPDGYCEISKVEGSGGIVNQQTCTEQLLYEIHNPRQYFTPDVIADFSKVSMQEIGHNRVAIQGATGERKTGQLKVSLGLKAGYVGEGQISYGGDGARARAKLALDILQERLSPYSFSDIRYDLVGENSLFQNSAQRKDDYLEVRVRVVGKSDDLSIANIVANEVEALYTNGPAGGGGAVKSVKPIIAVLSCLIPESAVNPEVHILEV